MAHLLLFTASTPVPQMQPWLIPVAVICACVLVLVCATIIIVAVVVGFKKYSGNEGST